MAPRRAPDERGPFLGTEQIIRRLREVRQPLWRLSLSRGALIATCASALVVATIVVFDRVATRRLPGTAGRPTATGDVRVQSRVDDAAPRVEATYDEAADAAPAAKRQRHAAAPAKRHVSLTKHRMPSSPPQEEAAPQDEDDDAAPQAQLSLAADEDDSLTGWELGDAPPATQPHKAAPPKPARKAPARQPLAPEDDPAVQAAVRIEVRGGPGSIFIDGTRVAVDESWETTLGHGEHHLMVRIGGRSMTYKLRLRGDGVKVVFDDAHSRIREESWAPRTP